MTLRHTVRTTLPLLLLALAAAACSTRAGSAGATPARSSMERITEAELEPIAQLSAFEAIQRLRPRWLQSRTGLLPTVHVDGSVRGDGEEILASIPSSEVEGMQYLSASDATTRFGTDYASGAILITTKK
ncbi:MAG TPA: hypothetical protein VLH75_05075 [Longimicrobiales bacterium]|nr:hypothetical protein [Longimicrobiales bacterium]